jgi:hypothetical protein
MLVNEAQTSGPAGLAGWEVWLHTDIDFFDPLHDYPPFQELMRPRG